MAESVSTKLAVLGESDAMRLASKAERLYSARGKKVTSIDLDPKPDRLAVKKWMLGPTGNLRAPTLKIGSTLVVGFNQETYEDLFG